MVAKSKPREKVPSTRPKEDKSFGMKNKSGGKGQQLQKDLERQAAQVGKNREVLNKEKERDAMKKRKLEEQSRKMMMDQLFTSVEIVQAKVPFGVDPKTLLCAFFKAGRCQKGVKCKYSHDLEQERKQVKASIYADVRDEAKVEDTMDKWDDERLKEVVGAKGNAATTTDIVCKHFIDAVEAERYGWFWECPDGGLTCKYRHALPPGFVLKSQRKKEEADAKKVEITLEEFLDVERHKLDQSKLTPLTLESFAKWKKTRMNKKEAEDDAIRVTKEGRVASNRSNGMSGRDLFTFNPNLGLDSDDEGEEKDEFDIVGYRAEAARRKKEVEEERMQNLAEEFDDYTIEDGV